MTGYFEGENGLQRLAQCLALVILWIVLGEVLYYELRKCTDLLSTYYVQH